MGDRVDDAATDAEALLRAVCAAPGDDAPRLVFADYLDEHGEPERAEFVRIQCELTRIESADHGDCGGTDSRWPCPLCQSGDALRRRERELWAIVRPQLEAVVPNGRFALEGEGL